MNDQLEGAEMKLEDVANTMEEIINDIEARVYGPKVEDKMSEEPETIGYYRELRNRFNRYNEKLRGILKNLV
jgi:hypothetical protein